MNNTHGGVSLLVKLQASIKKETFPRGCFSRFLKGTGGQSKNWFKMVLSHHKKIASTKTSKRLHVPQEHIIFVHVHSRV